MSYMPEVDDEADATDSTCTWHSFVHVMTLSAIKLAVKEFFKLIADQFSFAVLNVE